jgi:hypothetical protein
LFQQLSAMQGLFGEVASSQGMALPLDLAEPLASGPSAVIDRKPASAAPSAPRETASARAVAKAIATVGKVAASANVLGDLSSDSLRDPRVGEVDAPTTLENRDESRGLSTSDPTVSMPSYSDLGNMNQVVNALSPSSNGDTFAALRSGTVTFGTAANSPGSRSDRGTPMDPDAAKAKFGVIPQFNMAKLGRAKPVDPTADDDKKPAAKDKDDKDKKDKTDKAQDPKKVQDQMQALASLKPKFTFDQYMSFLNLISQNPDQVNQQAQGQSDFSKNAQSLFDEFADRDQVPEDGPKKEEYQNFLKGIRNNGNGSAIDDYFQPVVTPLVHEPPPDSQADTAAAPQSPEQLPDQQPTH